MRHAQVYGITLAVVLVFAFTTTASANGGPIVTVGSHGSVITPKSSTSVWVEQELLTFRLSYSVTSAEVTPRIRSRTWAPPPRRQL